MPLNSDEIWNINRPKGTDIDGVMPLDRKDQLPDRLREVPGRILGGFAAGKRLFILNVKGETPVFDGTQTTPENNILMSQDADVYNIARGLGKDSKFAPLLVVSPDDRENDALNNTIERYKALATAARSVEESTRDSRDLFKGSYGIDPHAGKQGIILVVTPALKGLLGQTPGREMMSKLLRVFEGSSETITIEQSNQNEYTRLEQEILTADIANFRALLIEVLRNPSSRNEAVPRASAAFEKEFITEGRAGQELALRLLQGMFGLPYNTLMWGEYDVGKTTLLVGTHQLVKAFSPNKVQYVHWQNFSQATAIHFERLTRQVKNAWVSIDQVDRGINETDKWVKDILHKPLPSTRIVMTSNTSPQKMDIKPRSPLALAYTNNTYDNPNIKFTTVTLDEHGEPKVDSPPPKTYNDFAQRTYAVQLGGEDFNPSGIEW